MLTMMFVYVPCIFLGHLRPVSETRVYWFARMTFVHEVWWTPEPTAADLQVLYPRCELHAGSQNYINSDEKPIMRYLKMIFTLNLPGYFSHMQVCDAHACDSIGHGDSRHGVPGGWPCHVTCKWWKGGMHCIPAANSREVLMRAWWCVP